MAVWWRLGFCIFGQRLRTHSKRKLEFRGPDPSQLPIRDQSYIAYQHSEPKLGVIDDRTCQAFYLGVIIYVMR